MGGRDTHPAKTTEDSPLGLLHCHRPGTFNPAVAHEHHQGACGKRLSLPVLDCRLIRKRSRKLIREQLEHFQVLYKRRQLPELGSWSRCIQLIISFQFDPKEAKDVSETCTEQPSLADKVHCIVYVIDASVVNLLDKELQNKFDEIHEEAHRLGIPQLVLLAKVDLTCNIVKDDLSKVYQSRYIKQMVIKVSQMVGVPVSCILPVRNYSSETDLDMKVDILILKALQTILRQSEAFFDEIKQRGKTPLTCEGISSRLSNS
ncbi:interferon-induced protein 44-like [Polypterus senegalus]|uniref:interferon-induced protein 44-like n=1 Tax=Polypterus senegalus TaxID=55291 RepID=UPI00196634D7|nr:interferon-induced protein 44-like [Polypterus senegalus]